MSLFYSEGELTLSWAWVLIGIALSQVLGGPMAAGEPHTSGLSFVGHPPGAVVSCPVLHCSTI